MTESTPPQAPSDGYAAALAELQKILDALEAPDVDVDALASHVDRAAELLRFCRERLVAAETQVTEIVAGLEDLATESDTPEAASAADPDG
ncbi:MAG: exodeoxyribonuclease VII small subunit [bacterium]|nr:exodeoxyribonuclease VII small subunit [bacterium]MXV91286.1 exodeoxyribonuclease VII small subunit [Acidimicrobiia bacterium]MYC46249.1 exodeoxyribonuclease VII small subunit [Acidimicrobiia bacterium]MYI20707.1 exodeoxyribonuclease VII small subunit [Acidimicrobiia bacterium]